MLSRKCITLKTKWNFDVYFFKLLFKKKRYSSAQPYNVNTTDKPISFLNKKTNKEICNNSEVTSGVLKTNIRGQFLFKFLVLWLWKVRAE